MSPRLAAWGAALLAGLVHLWALPGEFVYDDVRFVAHNPAVRSAADPGRFFTDLSTTAAPERPAYTIYRPLRTLSYAILGSLGAKGATLYHLPGILLHALAVGLLVRLLLAAGTVPLGSFAAALCFGLHPRTVEVAAQISALGDGVAFACVLASLLAHAKGRRVWAFAFFAVGLFGKEHAVIAPLLWACWDFALERARLRRTLLRAVLPGLALCGVFVLWRRHLGVIPQLEEPLGGSHVNAVLTMLSGLAFYAAGILFPVEPTVGAEVAVQTGLSVPVLLGLATLGALGYGLVKGSPRVRLGCAWFLAALVPVSNLIVPLKIPTADRFLYPSLAGLSFVAAAMLARTRLEGLGRKALYAALPLLALLTLHRTLDWRSDEARNVAQLRGGHTLPTLWARAAGAAQKALAAMRSQNLAAAPAHLSEAVEHYNAVLRNMSRSGQRGGEAQVRREFGDLLYETGEWHMRVDEERDARKLYESALLQYGLALQLQRAGLARRVPKEEEKQQMRWVARRIVEICVRLALPEEKKLEDLIQTGLDAANELQGLDGLTRDDPRLQALDDQRGRLLLVRSIARRAQQPARVRKDFERILEYWDTRGDAFLRGQCWLYLSILKDREPDRAGLERGADANTRSHSCAVSSSGDGVFQIEQ